MIRATPDPNEADLGARDPLRIWFEIDAHAASAMVAWRRAGESRGGHLGKGPRHSRRPIDESSGHQARRPSLLTHLASTSAPMPLCPSLQTSSSTRYLPNVRSCAPTLLATWTVVLAALQEARLRAQEDDHHRPQPPIHAPSRPLSASSSPTPMPSSARGRSDGHGAHESRDLRASRAVGTFANRSVRQVTLQRRWAGAEPCRRRSSARSQRHVFRDARRIASSIDRLATEIRHLSARSAGGRGILLAGQKGSSAMPPNRNR